MGDEETGGGAEGAAEGVPCPRGRLASLVREPGVDAACTGDEDQAVEARRRREDALGRGEERPPPAATPPPQPSCRPGWRRRRGLASRRSRAEDGRRPSSRSAM